jgi:hypothetical protein
MSWKTKFLSSMFRIKKYKIGYSAGRLSPADEGQRDGIALCCPVRTHCSGQPATGAFM